MNATAIGSTLTVCEDWRERAAAHAERAADLTAGRRHRASRGLTDPIEDFLYDYYSLKPRDLTRWHAGVGVAVPRDLTRWHAGVGVAVPRDLTRRHAGVGVAVTGPAADLRTGSPEERAAGRSVGRWMREITLEDGREAITIDTTASMAERGTAVATIHRVLERTAARAATFGCFGWHEWAMVYRQDAHRHPLPLRLRQEGTDAVVESATIACTHYDAFRFFTPAAAPRNRHQLTREVQVDFEQPGCLHANMDSFKWALKLGPACPGDLLLDALELAKRIRRLDMAASPYDCAALGLEPVKVETPEGRAAYVRAQREFAEESTALRARLLAVTTLLTAEDGPTLTVNSRATAPSAGPTPPTPIG